MQAIYLVKNGAATKAFEIRDSELPEVEAHEVRIKVKAFGLNFADVMARLGVYDDAPAKPGVLGYDVLGYIDQVGSEAKTTLKEGDHVIALTRFGGYAEYVKTDARAVVPIDEHVNAAEATALTTQGGTAYYMSHVLANIFEGDHILIHAAAGGVGSLLVQMVKAKKGVVYGTAGSSEKLEYLRSLGVDHCINYREESFDQPIAKLLSEQDCSGLDIVFDAIGGNSVKKGMKLLGSGGRMILFGASSLTTAKNIFSKIGVALGFGLYSPIGLLTPSKSLIGVNMLRIADDKPEMINRVITGTVDLYQKGIIKPKVGGVYSVSDLAIAHHALETRKTMGKIAITW